MNRLPSDIIKELENYFMHMEYENSHRKVEDFYRLTREYNTSMTTVRKVYKGNHRFSSENYKEYRRTHEG